MCVCVLVAQKCWLFQPQWTVALQASLSIQKKHVWITLSLSDNSSSSLSMEDILEDLSFVLCFEIRIGKTLRCLSLSYLYLYYTLLLYLLNVFLRLFLKNAMFGNELKHLSLWCCWWKEAFCCQLRSACKKKKKNIRPPGRRLLDHLPVSVWFSRSVMFDSLRPHGL